MNPSHNILSDSVGPKTIFAASDPAAAAASGGQRRDFDEEDGVRPSAEGEREREEKVVETVLSPVAARRGAPTAHLSHLTCCCRCILTCAHSSPSPQDGGGGGDRLTWAGADLERLSALAAASALLARCWPSSPEEPEKAERWEECCFTC